MTSTKRKLENDTSSNKKQKSTWFLGLKDSMKDPNLLMYEDDDVCVIKDKFPKVRSALQCFQIRNLNQAPG